MIIFSWPSSNTGHMTEKPSPPGMTMIATAPW
jgi:hypothetical protein